MKAGRNDPCPCGSGAKYKKCCLAKDQEESAAQSAAESPPPSSAASPGPEPLLTQRWKSGRPTAPARVEVAQEPTPPRDPITERADSRWEEFKSSTEEGRIPLFLETLDDAEVITDEMAFGMLDLLRTDAMKRGDRSCIPAFVGALRERRPVVFDQSAHYYLNWCLLDALAEGRQEVVPSLARELAALAGRNIDTFDRVRNALGYHGQLSVLVEAFRIAWPGVKSSQDILPWAVSEFMNSGANLEIFDYLEQATAPDPADPVLLDRIKHFVAEPKKDYLREFVSDLTGTSGRELQADDFALRPLRKRRREDWDDDHKERESPDQGAINLSRLISGFVGYLRREEGVPFPRGDMVRRELYRYFVRRHEGELDPRPSMIDQVVRPNLKLPKPPRPAHPLCPERVTLDVCLGGMMGFMNGMYHSAAALYQAIPAWLRFLESRRLIDADLRRKVADELLPLHATLLRIWQDFTDDPALNRQGQAWLEDAAKGPRESTR